MGSKDGAGPVPRLGTELGRPRGQFNAGEAETRERMDTLREVMNRIKEAEDDLDLFMEPAKGQYPERSRTNPRWTRLETHLKFLNEGRMDVLGWMRSMQLLCLCFVSG